MSGTVGAWLGLVLASALLMACPRSGPVSFAEPPPDGTTVTCPVSGQRCLKGAGTRSAVLDERNYYFCSEEAWMRFQEAPARYRD